MLLKLKKFRLPLIIAFMILIIIVASRYYDMATYLSFSFIQQSHLDITSWSQQHLFLASLIYLFAIAIFSITMLPGAMFIPIVGAFFLGFWPVFLLSLPGVTFSFGVKYLFFHGFHGVYEAKKTSRFLPKYSRRALTRISKNFIKYKLYYFLLLRLVPGFPSWIFSFIAVNANMKFAQFILWVFFGIVPAIAIYTYIGTSLGSMFDQGYHSWRQLLFHPQIYLPILGVLIIALSVFCYFLLQKRKQANKLVLQ